MFGLWFVRLNVPCRLTPPTGSPRPVASGLEMQSGSGADRRPPPPVRRSWPVRRCARAHPAPRWADTLPRSASHVLLYSGMVGVCCAGGWTDATMSVMTGSESQFPTGSAVGNVQLPPTLKVRYKQPDAYHPKLRFWFTPDSFEQLGTADGTAVASWSNVANICYPGHASADCTTAKQTNGENMAPESLRQASAGSQPVYKKALVNGRGAVRFTRGAVDGTSGKYLQMETTATSGTAGFTTNPFTANTYTIFLVARTQPGNTDTGVQGVLNLAKASSDSTLDGLSLYKDSVVCASGGGKPGLGCAGTTCSKCDTSKYTTFGTYSARYGATAVTDDNSCTSLCVGTCSLSSVPAACQALWGPANNQNFQDSDQWHVIVLQVDGTVLKGYIDGYHASSTPPIYVSAGAAATIAQLRLGLVDQADQANSVFVTPCFSRPLTSSLALAQAHAQAHHVCKLR